MAPVMDMSLGFFVTVFAVSFAGVVIQTTSGFGYGVTVMSVLPFIVPDLSIAVAVTGILSATQSVISAWRYRKNIPWKLLPALVGCFFVTNFIAIRFAAAYPVNALRRPMGAFLIILALYFIFFAGKIKIKGSPAAGCTAGCIAGIGSGFFSISGPPAVVYLISATSSNAAYMAGMQTYFASTGFYATMIRLANGLITYSVLKVTVPAIIGLVLGMMLGTRLFDKLNPARLRKLVYAVMVMSGLSMLITG